MRAKDRTKTRNKVKHSYEWGQTNGRPWITTVEQRWDYDASFQRSMKEQNLTREDMIAITELGNSEGENKPQNRTWIDQHCEGKYHLTSINKKGGTTRPLHTVPGFKE